MSEEGRRRNRSRSRRRRRDERGERSREQLEIGVEARDVRDRERSAGAASVRGGARGGAPSTANPSFVDVIRSVVPVERVDTRV